jgi:DNA-binding beta-propeller fold protein YncE
VKRAVCGGRPYDVVLSHNGALLYVSDWAGRAVLAVRPEDLHVISRIAVGEHPNQLALAPKDDRLFVACASTNNVSVIDTKRGIVSETIYTPLFPRSPEGSTPDALAIAPDGKTLYVANGKSPAGPDPQNCAKASAATPVCTYANQKGAAEIFLRVSKIKLSQDEVEKMLADPDTQFSTTPNGIMQYVMFMRRAGAIKNVPAKWSDLFMPELASRNGS